MSEKRIVFILSTPRSGSTLLQRILATGNSVYTAPESWFFVKQFANSNELMGFSEIGYLAENRATFRFEGRGGENRKYLIYRQAYLDFLDIEKSKINIVEKTPRNLRVHKSIIDSNHDKDRFILLRRSASDIFESHLEYFDSFPYFKSYKFKRDIKNDINIIDNIVQKEDPRIISVSYDDLIADVNSTVSRLALFLEDDTIKADSLPNVGTNSDFGDSKGRQLTNVTQIVSKKSYLIRELTKVYVLNQYWRFWLWPHLLFSWVIYRFNINLLIYGLRKTSFLH